MAKVDLKIIVSVYMTDTEEDLQKVVAREVIAGIATSIDNNQNVEDIAVTAISSELIIIRKQDLMPTDELATL